PRRFEMRESIWNWPLNRAVFDPKIAGGGVFIDMSPHALAMLGAWFGPVELLEYRDDNCGGLEATSWARVRCSITHGDVEGDIFMTRAQRTPNYVRIFCDGGMIELDPHETTEIKITLGHGSSRFETIAQTTPSDPFVKQLENFVHAIKGKEPLAVSTEEDVAAVALIESAYRNREPLSEPWVADYSPATVETLGTPYRKILVTGATGAVGSRLVEMWS